MAEPFPAWTRVRVPVEYVLRAAAVAIKLGHKDFVVVTYNPDERPGPWFCFDVGERQFGIWCTTGKLYEADEYGAMGEDPIEMASLS